MNWSFEKFVVIDGDNVIWLKSEFLYVLNGFSFESFFFSKKKKV